MTRDHAVTRTSAQARQDRRHVGIAGTIAPPLPAVAAVLRHWDPDDEEQSAFAEAHATPAR